MNTRHVQATVAKLREGLEGIHVELVMVALLSVTITSPFKL